MSDPGEQTPRQDGAEAHERGASWFSPIYSGGTSSKPERRQITRVISLVDCAELPETTRLAAGVWATMLFPGDSEFDQRSRWAAGLTATLGFRAWRQGDVTRSPSELGAELIGTRLQALAVLEYVFQGAAEMERRWAEGLVAGHLLRNLILMDMDPEFDASIEKSVAMVIGLGQGLQQSGSRVASRTALREIWKRQRHVSHFWAAFDDWAAHFKVAAAKSGGDSNSPLAQQSVLESLLARPQSLIVLSFNYLQAAQRIGSRHASGGVVLPWWESWLVPAQHIPKGRPKELDPRNTWSGLSEAAKAVLRAYKDPRSKPT